ncbi:hypothetical protein Tco_0190054 [Tanacetum coccineum]
MSIPSLLPCMCASAALLGCSSGGDVYPCQAYDMKLIMTEQLSIPLKCMNTVVYVNEARQATMNIDDSSNGYERVNLDVTCTPNDEQTAPVVGDEVNSTREKIELRADVALKGTIVVDVPKHTGEGFSRCIVCVEYKWKLPRSSDWSKVKVLIKQVYQPVSKKNGANTSGKKEQVDLDRQELIDAFDSPTTTPSIERINNLQRKMLDGKLVLVDDDGKPLKSLNSGSTSGYGTKSLLEQWRETKVDGDYDPYDDDLYDGYDMSENLRAIYDYLDIKAEM